MPLAMTLLGNSEAPSSAARAHAMKNCVAVIRAISHLLERDIADRGRERLARLQLATDRLRELLADALSAKPCDTVSPSQTICVKTLVGAVVARLGDKAESLGVEIVSRCGEGSLVGDEVALSEALFNLVCNAIDASVSGSTVSVTTNATEDGDQVWVIEDTGHGIPAEALPDIGRPFYSRRAGGSGLGLALARAAVTRQGGLLRIESREGSGTSVTVYLPRARVKSGAL